MGTRDGRGVRRWIDVAAAKGRPEASRGGRRRRDRGKSVQRRPPARREGELWRRNRACGTIFRGQGSLKYAVLVPFVACVALGKAMGCLLALIGDERRGSDGNCMLVEGARTDRKTRILAKGIDFKQVIRRITGMITFCCQRW